MRRQTLRIGEATFVVSSEQLAVIQKILEIAEPRQLTAILKVLCLSGVFDKPRGEILIGFGGSSVIVKPLE